MWHSLVRYYDGNSTCRIRTLIYSMFPARKSTLCTNHVPPPPTLADRRIVALRPVMVLPPNIHARLSRVHNSKVGHWGLDICKRRLREARQRQGGEISPIAWYQSSFDSTRHVRWWVVCDSRSKLINLRVLFIILLKCFIWIITKDTHGNEYILVIIDAFSRWVELLPHNVVLKTFCHGIFKRGEWHRRASLQPSFHNTEDDTYIY